MDFVGEIHRKSGSFFSGVSYIYIYIGIYIYLVSGFKHVLNFPFHIWDIYIYTYSLYPFSILGETSSFYMFYMFTASFLMAWKRLPPSFDW